jgi:hypothetical protein
VLSVVVAGATASGRASAATLTVCPSGCAFSQIAPALAAAKNGDTVSLGAGTYTGGLTVDKSIKLVGAGAARTTISGGGPVLTIGAAHASSEPTVEIDGVTITGGVTRSSWNTGPGAGVIALGGGIEIPPNADFSGGATVTISNSVITGNRVAPSATAPSPGGAVCPGGGLCPFAAASGGGIDNWGTLTIANSTVSDNSVGDAPGLSGLASDAEGGGIRNVLAGLTISNSVISGNQAPLSAPNGRHTTGAGIFVVGGTIDISNSSVTNNSATLAAALPSSVGMEAHGAGVSIDNAEAATIANSTISGNSATMTNSVGDTEAFSGGLHTNPAVTLSNDVIANNHVTSMTRAGSTGNADGSAGAGEINGTMSNVRLTGNTVDVRSTAGGASGEGGASVFDGGSFANSVIGDNHVHVAAPAGSATIQGAGFFVAVSLTLRNSTVSGNTADVGGATGSAQGGGIFDVAFPFGPDGPPGGPLVLQNSNITGNVLTGGAGIAPQGGGLYIQSEPLTMTNSVITANTPDQCFGC